VCARCSFTREFLDPEFLALPGVQAHLSRLAARLIADQPLLPCDDPDGWDWRAWIAASQS
jgi:hypothetical protein